MRVALATVIILGGIVGSTVSYFALRPLTDVISIRTSILTSDTSSAVQLRGVILGIDTAAREMTIRVFYPAFPDHAAPFKIPFDAIQNFSNSDLDGQSSDSGREYIPTAKVGQIVSMNILRKPGKFLVLSLSVRSPTSTGN